MEHQSFINRKLHSLLGVIPLGIFLVQHLVVNHFATEGANAFNKAAGFMEHLPFRYFLEIFVILLPIVFHAVYGIYIAFVSKSNVSRFGFFRNIMFTLQRVTGVLTLIFVVWHIWQTRIQAQLGKDVNYDMMADILSNHFMLAFYILGVLSTIFHFSNGLWSFFVSWGITVSPKSQKIMTYITMIVFVALSYVGISAILAFV